jgi:hypothetical protein
MKLNCPECAAPIPPQNINIQQMAAVCPDCGAVFPFETSSSKSKRRKVHQPQNLELHETDDHVHMAFRTNFRLAQNGPFLSSTLLSIASILFTAMMTNRFLSGEVISVIPVAFAMVTLALFYSMALIAYNKTHIEMDDEKISVSRGPIPVLLEQKQDVSLQGVTDIRYEETAISKKEGYDLPRYNVWAETADGSRRIIVKDMTEEYAVYIAQRLNEQLALDLNTEMDVSRLTDDDAYEIEDDAHLNTMLQTSQENRQTAKK